MAGNKNLQHAKAAKFDEFYTQYNDISNEVSRYRSQLKGKVIYCNCDDPTWSNFWKYFHNNFRSLGLKKLIATHYVANEEPSYALIYEGGDDFDMEAGEQVTIHGDGTYTAGDFRSQDCLRLLEEADVTVSNPPFSLWIPYLDMLIKHNKRFLIIGNMNALAGKALFPLIRGNKVWAGYQAFTGSRWYVIGNQNDDYVMANYPHAEKRTDGVWLAPQKTIWLTDLDVSKRHDGLWHRNGEFDQAQAHCYYEGNENKYPHYDNFDGIDVGSIKDIPIDYSGYMGCPITVLENFNPDEIELIGIGSGHLAASIGVKKNYRGRTDIAYTTSDGKHKCPFSRIIIRNLHPISRADDKGY